MKKKYPYSKKTLISAIFFNLSLLLGFSMSAQIVNFTIDTAIDDNISFYITETIISGTDTYVLKVDHAQNVETLDDLGGGDLVFYLGSASSNAPFILTITKNGQPTNFDLISIDYDLLTSPGTLSLTNQNGAFISNPTLYQVGSGTLSITNPGDALNINKINIIPTTVQDLNNFGFHNITVQMTPTLGVDENAMLAKNVSVFPNPSNGDIEIRSNIGLEKAVVVDLNGRKVITYKLNGIIGSQNLKMNALLSQGVYFMTVFSAKNTITKKLVIH
ncbi:MAG: T9SS type A sorting domain-containing protein [Algibacter sp.]|uniref:T9SS type A sorting domain-containing protein n=1 Tax=Algibacter sp. TaxID=1872428 RepID=UPI0032971150